MKSKGLEAFSKFCDSTNACVNSGGITNVDLMAKEQVEKELVECAQYKQAINVFKSIGFTLSETIGGEYFIIIGEKEFKLTKKSHDLLKKVCR